jgi:hypothetical protein
MSNKQRLSASVDADLLTAAQHAVDAGHAASLSAWVNDALRLKADHERRLAALDEFLAGFESTHGAISDQDIDDALHRARGRAVVIRSKPQQRRPGKPRSPTRRGAA